MVIIVYPLSFLGAKNVMVIDPEVARTVMVKDFDHMPDRRAFHFHNLYLDNLLITLEKNDWKRAREKFSPFFSCAKMKAFLPFMDTAGDLMMTHLDKVDREGAAFDAKDVLNR